MDNNEELPSFENYQVLRELGRGGMGVVYLAEDKRLNRQVALKVIHAAKIHSISKDQIINEAKILANLNHANIVHLYDIVEEHDSIALVMEYVDGIDLKRAIAEQYVSLEQKIIWLRQIAQALEYAHDHNVLHRDIKPENILVSSSNIAKLSDFGISEVISGTHARSFKEHSQNKSEKFSSLLTLSPEEINGASVDTKSDLFSLGCVCYTLLCGKHPFVTGSVVNKNEIIKNILHNEPVNPKDFNPNIPAAICQLVVSLLQKDQSKRPPNAADIVSRLVAHEKNPSGLNDVDLTETLPARELYKASARFSTWLKGALAMLVVVVCCVTGYWIYDSRPIEKKYVAIYEPALWDSEGVSDIEKDLYLSASVWIREYLLTHPNVSVLETSVAEKPGISIEDFFKQTAADEVVTTNINCVKQSCNLYTRFIERDNLSVSYEIGQRVIADDLGAINGLVGRIMRQRFGNDKTLVEDIDDDVFDAYLELYAGYFNGQLKLDYIIDQAEKLHSKNPNFAAIYDLWIKSLREKYYDSNDRAYLDSMLDVINVEKKFVRNSTQIFFHELHYYLNIGEYPQAEMMLINSDQYGLSDEEILKAYSVYYIDVGDHEKSDKYLRKLIQLRPSVDNYYNAAINSWWDTDFRSLEFYASRILEIDSENLSGIELYAISKLSQGDLEKAENFYKDLISYRDDSDSRNNLGLVYMLGSKYMQAVEQFEHAVLRSPKRALTKLNLAEAKILSGDNVNAVEILNEVISLTKDAKSSDMIAVRAQALAHLGDYLKAIEIVKKLESKHPDNYEILYTAAIVYYLAGENLNARASAELALNKGLGRVWLQIPWLEGICNSGDIVDNSLDCFQLSSN